MWVEYQFLVGDEDDESGPAIKEAAAKIQALTQEVEALLEKTPLDVANSQIIIRIAYGANWIPFYEFPPVVSTVVDTMTLGTLCKAIEENPTLATLRACRSNITFPYDVDEICLNVHCIGALEHDATHATARWQLGELAYRDSQDFLIWNENMISKVQSDEQRRRSGAMIPTINVKIRNEKVDIWRSEQRRKRALAAFLEAARARVRTMESSPKVDVSDARPE